MAKGAVHDILDPALAPAFAASQAICRRGPRSFHAASVFLPRVKRNAACAVHAFFRMIDEALREPGVIHRTAENLRHHPTIVTPASLTGHACGVGGELEDRIAMLRNRLDEIYDGRLELPAVESRSPSQHALYAFEQTVRRYQIPRQHFVDFAESIRIENTIVRYPTWTRLDTYCNLAGGVVAQAIAGALGLQHSDAGGQMAQLGRAIRLAAILQHLKHDLDHGRIFLPLEDLARFRYSEKDLMNRLVNDEFRALMKFEVDRARDLYRKGSEGLCWLADDGSRLAAATVIVSHTAILTAIEQRNYNLLDDPVELKGNQKLRRLARAWRLARRSATEPLPDVLG
jgi:phytoene synthase